MADLKRPKGERCVKAQQVLKVSDLRSKGAPEGATEFTVSYQLSEGPDAKAVVERVALDRVATRFGGARTYFRCPGPGCGRRVMALYLVDGLFRCRRCHGLAYECQGEDTLRHAERRADKARARLGYQPGRRFEIAPEVRPKGMWMRTFRDLYGRVLEADYAATEAFVARWQSLNARIERQADRRRLRQRD